MVRMWATVLLSSFVVTVAPVSVAPAMAAASAAAPAAPSPSSSSSAAASSREVQALVTRMQAFYEKTSDFRAEFEQRYRYQLSRRTQTSTGVVTFKKPALMRWEYLAPSPRTFVLAGDRVYAYDPGAKTLTKASLGTNQLSASVTFLWGQGKLEDEFTIRKADCKDCQGTLLELTPKSPDPRFKLLRLEVDPKTAQVLRSIVIDPDGSENAITFRKLQANVGVTRDFFKLKPAADTQVIDYSNKASPAAPTPGKPDAGTTSP